MTSISIVPATEELLIKFYGTRPPKTLRAIAAVREDEVLGVAGIFQAGMIWMMFSELHPEILEDKRTMVKALREIRKLIAKVKLPVYATADKTAEGAEILIRHSGAQLWQPS